MVRISMLRSKCRHRRIGISCVEWLSPGLRRLSRCKSSSSSSGGSVGSHNHGHGKIRQQRGGGRAPRKRGPYQNTHLADDTMKTEDRDPVVAFSPFPNAAWERSFSKCFPLASIPLFMPAPYHDVASSCTPSPKHGQAWP